MGIACYTGREGFRKGLTAVDGLYEYYRGTSKILLRPLISQFYFDIYKSYLASLVIGNKSYAHLVKSWEEKLAFKIEPLLKAYDPHRFRFLQETALRLKKIPNLKFNSVLNTLNNVDRAFLEMEFLRNPTHAFIYSEDGLFPSRFFEDNLRRYFLREIELLELDPKTHKAVLNEFEYSLNRLKAGDISLASSSISASSNIGLS